jgi:signal peptidase I
VRSRGIRVVAFLVFVGWFIALRPQALGGPAGWIVVAGESMEPNLHPGSLVVVIRQPEYQVGDIVAYRVPETDPGAGMNVIHRIVGGTAETGFVMRGDNTSGPDIWRPRPADIVGATWLVMPNAATALLFIRSPIVLAAFAAGLAAYAVLGLIAPSRRAPVSTATRLDTRSATGVVVVPDR